MKYLMLTILTLFAATAIPAAAGCAGEALNKDDIDDALSGKRIIATAPGGEEWKEDHCSNDALYKVGAGTAVDPREQVGAWSVTDNKVRYNYDGGQTYEFKLYENTLTNLLCWEKENGDIVATTVSEPEDIPDGSACSSSP